MEKIQTTPLWQNNVFRLALVSAFLLACEKAVDSIVSNKFVANIDPFTAASSYILVGGWFGVLVSFILAFVFGNVRHQVNSINLNQPKMFKAAIQAGIVGACSTFITLFSLQVIDLQLLYALTTSYILFIILIEWRAGKIELKTFVIPGIIVVLGSAIAAYDPGWISNKQNLSLPVLFAYCAGVFVVYNALFATDELLQKVAVDGADPMNVHILRFVTLAVTATLGVFVVAILRGKLSLLSDACVYLLSNPGALLTLLVLFVIATVGMVTRLQAKELSDDVTRVAITVSGNLAIGLPISLVLNAVWPGAAGDLPGSLITLGVRVLGALVIGLGIYTLIKSYQQKK